MQSERIDKLLVQQSKANSRTLAQKLIKAGAVRVELGGCIVSVQHANERFPLNIVILIDEKARPRFVSRAGDKLAHALNHYIGIQPNDVTVDQVVSGLNTLDVGQSTGGFTDCVLQHGAASVLGIDVGHGQLDSSLRGNARVTCWEGVNARALDANIFLELQPTGFDLITMDVSFISQTLILPNLAAVSHSKTLLFSLVKPQFEVGPDGLGKGGIVKNTALFSKVESTVCGTAEQHGWEKLAYIESQPQGADGNQEFFLIAQRRV